MVGAGSYPPLEPDRALGATGALSRVGVRLGSTMAQKPGRPACAPNSSTPGLLRSGKLTGSATDCVPSTMCRPRSPGAPDRRWRTRRTDPPRDSWHRSPWLAPPKPRGPGRTALGGHLGRRPGPSTRRRRSASLAPSVASPYFVGGLIEGEDNLSLQTPEQFLDRFRSTSGSTKSWLPLTGTSPTGVRRDGLLRTGHARASLSTKSAQPNPDSSESLRILSRFHSAGSPCLGALGIPLLAAFHEKTCIANESRRCPS